MNREEIQYKNDIYSQIAESPYSVYEGNDIQSINDKLPEDYTIIEDSLPKGQEPKDSLLLYSPTKNELVYALKGTTLTNLKELKEDFNIFRDFVKEIQQFKSSHHDVRHGALVQTAKEYNKKKGDIDSIDINNFQLEIIRLHNKLTDFISKYKLDTLNVNDRPSIKIVSHSLGGAKGLGVQEALRTIDFPDFESEEQINIYYKPYKIPNLFDVEHISFAPMPYPSNPNDNSFYFLNGVKVSNHKNDQYVHDPMKFIVFSTNNDFVVQSNVNNFLNNLLSRGQVKAINGQGNINYDYVEVDQKESTGHLLSNFIPKNRKTQPFSKKVLQHEDFVNLMNRKSKLSDKILIKPVDKSQILLEDNIYEVFGASKQIPKQIYDISLESRKPRRRTQLISRTNLPSEQPLTQSKNIVKINKRLHDYSLEKYCKQFPNDFKCKEYQLGLEIG